MVSRKQDIEELNRRLCRASESAFPGARPVLGEGPVPCPLMVIGEAPGRDETKALRPFIGKGGSFFIEAFERASGMRREEAYVTNAVKVWPFVQTARGRTRKPFREELELFAPFLLEEIRLVDPAVIIAVGKTAFSSILPDEPFEPGKWKSFDGREVMAVYHPSYLLRQQKSLPESSKALELSIREAAGRVRGT